MDGAGGNAWHLGCHRAGSRHRRLFQVTRQTGDEYDARLCRGGDDRGELLVAALPRRGARRAERRPARMGGGDAWIFGGCAVFVGERQGGDARAGRARRAAQDVDADLVDHAAQYPRGACRRRGVWRAAKRRERGGTDGRDHDRDRDRIAEFSRGGGGFPALAPRGIFPKKELLLRPGVGDGGADRGRARRAARGVRRGDPALRPCLRGGRDDPGRRARADPRMSAK